MQPFIEAVGRAVVLPQPNIDTDIIIRINRLTESRTHPEGRRSLGRWAFEALRYDANGAMRLDCMLNDPAWRHAPILLAGPNFGCGSSREGAVWALMQAGFRCVISESFGDIFYGNCFQNGMLPIVVSAVEMAALASEASRGAALHVDLLQQTVSAPGMARIPFVIDGCRRAALLQGLDDVAQSMQQAAAIDVWQANDRVARPWMWPAWRGR